MRENVKHKENSFNCLAEPLKKWIAKQGWESLREIQTESIKVILSTENDVIIEASTAGGKTEAAFLPILTAIEKSSNDINSCRALYIGPLKALINDQFDRILEMSTTLGITVTAWHGDINSHTKKKFSNNPDGVLLVTPESLEAQFVNNGSRVAGLYKNLSYIVIDEIHTFIGTQRGTQVQSLIARLETIIGRHVTLIGLSATIGDKKAACKFLRPNSSRSIHLISSNNKGKEILLQVRGYTNDGSSEHENVITNDLFNVLRGSNNLIFANSRNTVERYSDNLKSLCTEKGLINEFHPHHGGLSKDLRLYAEEKIKCSQYPASLICTSTLEMGVDIGTVISSASIGNPCQVSSMIQRLGRCGRRGNSSIMRSYIVEKSLAETLDFYESLRLNTIQSIAMTELLLHNWCETPVVKGLNLSTLIQQILSLIAQYHGVNAEQLWSILCLKGPFSLITTKIFIQILKCMGDKDLIIQSRDGTLLHGIAGEKLVNNYEFYASFSVSEEVTLIAENKRIGTIPIDQPLRIGSIILLGGARWVATGVDYNKKIVYVKNSKNNSNPVFRGKSGLIDSAIHESMRNVLMGTMVPSYLNNEASKHLNGGRCFFKNHSIDAKPIIERDDNAHLLIWSGDLIHDTIAALFQDRGMFAIRSPLGVIIKNESRRSILPIVENIVNSPMIHGNKLAKSVISKQINKYDEYLSEELLNISYASHRLDVKGAVNSLGKLLQQ